jgi:dienelactone hydrolase
MARLAGLVLALATTLSCGDNSAPGSPTPPPVDPLAGFVVVGNPESATGATWTYQAQAGGVSYDLQGILLKPQGSGPFPAVIISHGGGENVSGYSSAIARVMVGWGLVCIATNYAHAGGVPVGSPGSALDPGPSVANVQRARQLVEILRSLRYVDMTRLALHGHSLGAFVTTATAGTHPDLFRVASHTSGGIRPDFFDAPVPSETQARAIRAPYQIHHGDRDFVIPLAADQLFAATLTARGTDHELIVYPGADHNEIGVNGTVLDRIRAWYARKGLF